MGVYCGDGGVVGVGGGEGGFGGEGEAKWWDGRVGGWEMMMGGLCWAGG